jgi:hypothetical protein
MIIHFRNTRFYHRALCWFLVAMMATTQSMGIQSTGIAAAQPRETAASAQSTVTGGEATASQARLDLTHCTDRACAALFVHPRRVLTDPAMEMLPIEVFSAAGLKELGIDPLNVEQLQAFIEPPMAGPPSFVVVVKFTQPFRGSDLKGQLRAHTMPGELDGKKYLQSQHPILPSFYMAAPKTLLVATDEMLRRIVAGREESASSPLLDELKSASTSDVYVLVNLDMIRPLVNLGLQQVRQLGDVPPPVVPLLEAPDLIRSVDATMNLVSAGNLAPTGPTQLVIHASDEDAAKKLAALVDGGLAKMRQQMLAELERQERSDDPVERAMAQYMKRISGQMTELYRPTRDGEKLVLGGQAPENNQQLYSVATMGILVALLLPAVQAAREAARRTSCANNLKQLMLALLNYESVHGQFPAQANYDKEGKPLLSWRVHILPMLEEQSLYDQFHLDEPWDSPHNKQLIDKMPEVYRCPSSPLEGPRTTYLMPHGKGLVLEGKEGIPFGRITDGTSKTIALVEVKDADAVVWTKPEDLEWDPKNPIALLGSYHPGSFHVAFVDGSIHLISKDIGLDVLKSLFTRNGGEIVDGGF